MTGHDFKLHYSALKFPFVGLIDFLWGRERQRKRETEKEVKKKRKKTEIKTERHRNKESKLGEKGRQLTI